MNQEDNEPSPEDIERWTRNLTKGGVSKTEHTPVSADERKMIAKVFGTKTQAEEFLRHESRPAQIRAGSRIDLRRPFKSRPPVLRFEYWERTDGRFGLPQWTIERFENGVRVKVHTGQDWQKRNDLLIKLQAAGHPCLPITVAGVIPTPIQGLAKDKPKKPSSRIDIMKQVGKLTTDDLEDFE
ncbi:hypothetical protein [Rhizobium sp. HT1-10]|uniref:hypothetical protein n=1 Tax=Rhizobium sp. HT1-10 TaxID=3111638 RepID=UPI003C2A1528